MFIKNILNNNNFIKILGSTLINSLVCCIFLYFFIVDESWINLFVTFFQKIKDEEVVMRFVISMFPVVFIIFGLFRFAEEFIFSQKR